MFREIILPIFRSTKLCVTPCGIMHRRCCRPPASFRLKLHVEKFDWIIDASCLYSGVPGSNLDQDTFMSRNGFWCLSPVSSENFWYISVIGHHLFPSKPFLSLLAYALLACFTYYLFVKAKKYIIKKPAQIIVVR